MRPVLVETVTPALPIAQDDPPDQPSHDETSGADRVSWYIAPNSLAAVIAEYKPEVEERFGYEIDMVAVPDENWGDNLFQVEDVARQNRSNLEQQWPYLPADPTTRYSQCH